VNYRTEQIIEKRGHVKQAKISRSRPFKTYKETVKTSESVYVCDLRTENCDIKQTGALNYWLITRPPAGHQSSENG
jgi:hypothetical protein